MVEFVRHSIEKGVPMEAKEELPFAGKDRWLMIKNRSRAQVQFILRFIFLSIFISVCVVDLGDHGGFDDF